MPVVLQRIDQELERRRNVHPAVQQEEHRRRRARPSCARDSASPRIATSCEREGFMPSPMRGRASLFPALGESIVPAGRGSCRRRRSGRILFFRAAAAGAAIAEAQPIGRRKALQVDRRRRRLHVRRGLRRRGRAGAAGCAGRRGRRGAAGDRGNECQCAKAIEEEESGHRALSRGRLRLRSRKRTE